MKRKVFGSLVLAFVMVLTMTTSSLAAGLDINNGTVTPIAESGIKAGDLVSFLVVKANTDLANLTNEDVLFIDQKTADENGSVNFKFSLPKDTVVDVYSGFTSMTDNASPLSSTGYVVTTVQYDVVFKNADGSDIVTKQVIEGETVDELPTAATPIGKGFDNWYVGEDIFTKDSAVTASITVTAKLFAYGNANDDVSETVNGQDVVHLAKFIARQITSLTPRQNKAADANADGRVDGRDVVRIAQVLARFPGVTLGPSGN